MRGRLPAAELAQAGLFAALTAVCTFVTVPLPSGVPLTLQTFAVALGGYLLGPGYGALAVGTYLLLGAAGLPVFSGFTGGVGRFAGPTGGFLFGFLLLAAGCGAGRKGPPVLRFLTGLGGLVLCHLLGVLWYARTAGLTFSAAALSASLPFLPKDAASLAFALVFARLLEKRGVAKKR